MKFLYKILFILFVFLFFPVIAQGAATFIDPVEITPGTTNTWIDADVSAYVPAGATGVMIHIVNNTGGADRPVGFRKNGSTDNRTQNLYADLEHFWTAVGVDASRILELYVSSITLIDIYLVGYFTSEAAFFTNAPDKSLTTTGVWTDIDISADTGADTAIGAFFEPVGGDVTGDGSYSSGLRNNGSTDARIGEGYYQRYFGSGVIGVDANEICEGYISSINRDLFLLGYIKSQATFNVNAIDISLSATNTWTGLTALPAGGIGGIIEVFSGATVYYYGLRKNGSAENIYGSESRLNWGIVEADAGRIIEGKISNLAADFFLTGTINAAVATRVPFINRSQIIEEE